MKAVLSTIGQMILLAALGAAVGLGANAVRGKNHIKLFFNYAPQVIARDDGAKPGTEQSPYPVLTRAQVAAIVADDERFGLDLLVDARADQAFEAGHIPGAIQCDPYNIELQIDFVVGLAFAAERVIVYCESSDCEDSYIVCRELVARDVPEELIHLFKGGWEAWEEGADVEATARDDGGVTGAENRPEHPFDELTLAQVIAIYEHENTEYGLNLFVDARADDAFQEGHIPGAVQCDFYRLEHYLADLLERVGYAEQIVVYCAGGDCEDSLYVCGELLNADVPLANILLFKGGWEAWSEAGLPVETGREGP